MCGWAFSYISVHICASFQPASSLCALKESVYDPVKIWLLFFQHIPDSLGRTPKLLLKSMIEVGHAVVPNGNRCQEMSRAQSRKISQKQPREKGTAKQAVVNRRPWNWGGNG